MRLMTYNIWLEGCLEGGDRRERIAGVIRRHAPDVVCLQEARSEHWATLGASDGFQMRQAPQQGLTMFSRLPFVEHGEGPHFQYGKLAWQHGSLGVYNIHLPFRPDADETRISILRDVTVHMTQQEDGARCLMGDFNSRAPGEPGLPWVVEFISLRSGMTCAAGPEQWNGAVDYLSRQGWVDCYRRASSGAGFSYHPPTFKFADHPALMLAAGPARAGLLPLSVRLDYIFADPQFSERLRACQIDDSWEAFEASDHVPLLTDLE
jgi:endonuclease/exonuclease/phosphatase family metal-dependent hydrolase